MMTTINLEKGKTYDLAAIRLTGWTPGDGSGTEGYSLGEYFDADGKYLGPDSCGIEPVVVAVDPEEYRAWTWACANQGYAGSFSAWMSQDAEDRKAFEDGAAGTPTA